MWQMFRGHLGIFARGASDSSHSPQQQFRILTKNQQFRETSTCWWHDILVTLQTLNLTFLALIAAESANFTKIDERGYSVLYEKKRVRLVSFVILSRCRLTRIWSVPFCLSNSLCTLGLLFLKFLIGVIFGCVVAWAFVVFYAIIIEILGAVDKNVFKYFILKFFLCHPMNSATPLFGPGTKCKIFNHDKCINRRQCVKAVYVSQHLYWIIDFIFIDWFLRVIYIYDWGCRCQDPTKNF